MKTEDGRAGVDEQGRIEQIKKRADQSRVEQGKREQNTTKHVRETTGLLYFTSAVNTLSSTNKPRGTNEIPSAPGQCNNAPKQRVCILAWPRAHRRTNGARSSVCRSVRLLVAPFIPMSAPIQVKIAKTLSRSDNALTALAWRKLRSLDSVEFDDAVRSSHKPCIARHWHGLGPGPVSAPTFRVSEWEKSRHHCIAHQCHRALIRREGIPSVCRIRIGDHELKVRSASLSLLRYMQRLGASECGYERLLPLE